MGITAKITSKGQITIPKEIRNILHLQKGGVIVFENEGDQVVIKPARTLKDFKGTLKGKDRTADFDNIRQKAKEHIAKKVAKSGSP